MPLIGTRRTHRKSWKWRFMLVFHFKLPMKFESKLFFHKVSEMNPSKCILRCYFNKNCIFKGPLYLGVCLGYWHKKLFFLLLKWNFKNPIRKSIFHTLTLSDLYFKIYEFLSTRERLNKKFQFLEKYSNLDVIWWINLNDFGLNEFESFWRSKNKNCPHFDLIKSLLICWNSITIAYFQSYINLDHFLTQSESHFRPKPVLVRSWDRSKALISNEFV